jgi:prevent-host-death family protein
MASSIMVTVRELHARTGHYLRKATGQQRVIVTDNGTPIVELTPLMPEAPSTPYFARRKLRPEFKKMMEQGDLRPRPGDRDITNLISEDRD